MDDSPTVLQARRGVFAAGPVTTAATRAPDHSLKGDLFTRVAELLAEDQPISHGRAANDPRNPQELRLLRHQAAAATSLLALMVFGFCWMFGTLSTGWFCALGALVLGSIAVFGCLFRSGYNLRFRDASLTVPQMTTATVVTFAAMYAADSTRTVLVVLLLMAFLFGGFRLSTRAMLRYSVVVLGGYAGVIALVAVTRPETLDLASELLSWTCLATAMPWFALMTSYMARLRGKLGQVDDDQRRTMRALRASMTDLEEAQRIAQLGSWVVDPPGRRREWSAQMFRLFGLDPGGPTPDDDALLRFVHPADRDRYVSIVRTCLRELKPFDLEFRIVQREGAVRWVNAVGIPVTDDRGRAILMRGTLLDITTRKVHEEALLVTQRELTETKASLVDAIESLPDAFALYDRQDVLVLCNKAYAAMCTGRPQSGEVIGQSFESLVRSSLSNGEVIDRTYTGDIEGWLAHRIDRHRNPTGTPHEVQIGDGRWIQVIERHTSQGGIVGVRRDVTERKQLEQRQAMQHAIAATLAEAESLHPAIEKIIQAVCLTIGFECGALWRLDPARKLLVCTETWSAPDSAATIFLEQSRKQVLSPGSTGLIRRAWTSAEGVWISDIGTADDFSRADIALAAGLRSAFAFPIMVGKEPCGVLEFYAWQTRRADEALLSIAGSVGVQIGQFLARLEAQERVQTLAHFDPMTGLPNRSLFQQLLKGAIQQHGAVAGGISLLFIDLDGFKEINDRYGHDRGDQLLIAFAMRLRESLRACDSLARGTASAARFGGDEFVVLVEGVTSDAVLESIAARVLAMATEPFDVQGELTTISASVGISTCPRDGMDAESLVKAADLAMYAAKESGKNRIAFARRALPLIAAM